MPVNSDGGHLANGEPIGASGLRHVHESVVQLRSTAGARQVGNDPQTAFTQVYGASGILLRGAQPLTGRSVTGGRAACRDCRRGTGG
jgi:acetyl-CoA acetyltransferase